jgi:hypothetical protein
MLVLVLAPFAPGQKSPAPDVGTIVSRMVAARQDDQAHMRAYVVERDYRLLDTQEQPKAQVIASITHSPPDQNQYNIERSSGGMGAKVLRDIVQKENESLQGASRREISQQNYEFQLLGMENVDGRNCFVLSLSPRRDEKDLIRGKLWVDAADYRIHRLEGNPAKSPSWWIRDLHILMIFASVDGMWLHTFTQAIAQVRFKGTYVMESRDVQYSSGAETARRRRNPGILAGAVVNP